MGKESRVGNRSEMVTVVGNGGGGSEIGLKW